VPTILIIEDDWSAVRILELSLKQEGYQIITALDGERGLELARAQLPDLVLLDVMMPGMNGFEVCSQLRANPVTAHLPIVIITVRSQKADKETASEFGVSGYITKPFRRAELVATIKAALAEKRGSPPQEPSL
jgi:DNA-binding response OmpR family regulator